MPLEEDAKDKEIKRLTALLEAHGVAPKPLPMKSDSRAMQAKPGASTHLGKKAPDVPLAVHEACQSMADRGALPVTALAQRERARKSTSEIGVPQVYAQAKRFGYLGPNVPPPAGYQWKNKAGKWYLARRGG